MLLSRRSDMTSCLWDCSFAQVQELVAALKIDAVALSALVLFPVSRVTPARKALVHGLTGAV